MKPDFNIKEFNHAICQISGIKATLLGPVNEQFFVNLRELYKEYYPEDIELPPLAIQKIMEYEHAKQTKERHEA